MKKLTVIAAIPLFAGFLWAQADQTTSQTTTTTTTNNWNGTLVDAGCQAQHVAHRETTETTHPDENTTRTTTTKTDSIVNDCPVTMTTTTFGMVTPKGEYVTFDEPSNTKIVEKVKHDKKYTTYITEKKPVKVRVIGNKKGDVVVVESIQ
jgi:hypothetical protein